MSGQSLALVVHWLSAAVYPLAVLCAVVSDARRLLIPNWTSAAVAVAFLPAAITGGFGFAAIGLHYGIGLGLLAVGVLFFRLGALGGGDIKLLAAVGVWIGWDNLGPYLALVAALGGVLALAVMAAARLKRVWPALARIPWLGDGAVRSQALPYGVAIGAAAILLLARSPALPPAWAAVFN